MGSDAFVADNGVTTTACLYRQEHAMKERRIRCKECGERFSVIRVERERTSAYCDYCREERRREQARARMQALRDRRRQSLG
jgi:uncharacterized paraquat-inducible protein A